MNRIYFGDIKHLAAYMLDNAEKNKSVMAVLFYDKAKELLRELAKYDDIDIHSVYLEPEEWSGYSKEYYITLSGYFGLELYVEQGYDSKKERYLNYESDFVVLSGDASSQVARMNFIERASTYEAVFGDDDLACDDCDLCACSRSCGGASCDDIHDDGGTVHFNIDMNGNRYEGTISLNELFDILYD